MLSTEELATLTLKSPFVYEYGDAPYFKRCLNEFPLHFFVRYRASKDDPSQHRWSRLLEVVDRRPPRTADADAATTTPPPPTVAPLSWKEKFFFIALRVEGEDKCVELPRLSSKLPTAAEVMDYCARRAESQLRAGARREGEADADDVTGVTARAQLPTAREMAEMRAFRQTHIVNHRWTPEEVEAMREQNERMGRVGACSAPIRLTVTSLHNMRLETELGIASSRHVTGHTATAMERRSSTQLSFSGRANSPATPQSPAQPQGLWGSGSSLADLTATPLPPGTPLESSPLLSQEVLQRWEESKRDAESFYAYVSDDNRSAYMTKIAQITLKNYERNKLDRLRGIANEKRLDRRGNLLESGGLWIVDDEVRAQLARRYQIEQDGEAGTAGGGDAKKNATEAPTDDTATRETASPPVSEEDRMVQRFMAWRKTQDFSFASVPDEFMATVDEDAVEDDTAGAQRPPASTRSPELLLMDTSPQRVASQLLHKAASSMLKRPSSARASLAHSQGSSTSLESEPPKKFARRA
ncbi:uncharacterized protein Tco025E_02085 [Trypanosoma conorhini]|uniref:Uncharacterized protein n=1 Tax=Trypanosoma conorhini TaxID=83891 RepID=A0A3R7N5E7_9TRYP|nr:uncharacterized protein Tco025E_02085 [Trypanosoma conorhini]RNF25681.1 hypothetical protein Tco025E_02085 [Trypanosoma conorhini]